MASSSNIYTMGLMDKAVITSVTSEETGYPIENAFDFNPDTHWRPTSTANQVIDIDLGEAKSVDAFFIMFRDYNTDYDAGTQAIALASDDNDNGSYSAVSYLGGSAISLDNNVGDPLWLAQTAGTPVSKRYWRIVVANMAIISKISGFFLCRTRAVSIANKWPDEDSDRFYNRRRVAPSGREFVQRLNSLSFGPFRRSYYINGETDKDAIRNAFGDSFGGGVPVIHNEGSVYKLCRFDSDTLQRRQVDYQIYELDIAFNPVPYFADGENY